MDREYGYYWVKYETNLAQIAKWDGGRWWLAGIAKPIAPEAVTQIGGRITALDRSRAA